MRWVTAVSLVACALYPLASLAGQRLVRARARRRGRRRHDAQLLRGRGLPGPRRHDAADDGLLRAHAIRTTVNQAALFGSPFVGLAPLPRRRRRGGAGRHLRAARRRRSRSSAVVPELGREPEPGHAVMRENVAGGHGVAAGEPPAAQDRLGEPHAGTCSPAPRSGSCPPSCASTSAWTSSRRARRSSRAPSSSSLLTLPRRPRRAAARRRDLDLRPRDRRPGRRPCSSSPDARGAFWRRSSTASSCSRTAPLRRRSSGARAAEVDHDHQGLLNLAVADGRAGRDSSSACCSWPGCSARSASARRRPRADRRRAWPRRRSAFRRSLVAGVSRARPPHPRRHRLPRRRAAVRG